MDQWQCRPDCPCRGCADCTLCALFSGTPAGRKKTPCCIDLTMTGWQYSTCGQETCNGLNTTSRLAGPIAMPGGYSVPGLHDAYSTGYDVACLWRKCLATAICGWDRIELIYGATYQAGTGDGWTAYLALRLYSSTNADQYVVFERQIKSPLEAWPDCSAWSQQPIVAADVQELSGFAYGDDLSGCPWGETGYGETIYISASITATEVTDCTSGCADTARLCDACWAGQSLASLEWQLSISDATGWNAESNAIADFLNNNDFVVTFRGSFIFTCAAGVDPVCVDVWAVSFLSYHHTAPCCYGPRSLYLFVSRDYGTSQKQIIPILSNVDADSGSSPEESKAWVAFCHGRLNVWASAVLSCAEIEASNNRSIPYLTQRQLCPPGGGGTIYTCPNTLVDTSGSTLTATIL